MTLIEAKEFLRNKYFRNCASKEDVQKVMADYVNECFDEKNETSGGGTLAWKSFGERTCVWRDFAVPYTRVNLERTCPNT